MSNQLQSYEFWLLSGSLNRIARIMTPYPLDKSGTVIKFSKELDTPGQATFRIHALDPMLTTYGDIVQPHVNWLQIVKQGTVVWQGAIIENSRRTKDFIECVAVEPLWYLDKVLITRSSKDPSGYDPLNNGGLDGLYRIFNSGGMDTAVNAIINETINIFKANNAGHPLANLTIGTITNPTYPPNMSNAKGNALTGAWLFGDGTTAPSLQFDFHSVLYVLHQFGAYTYSDFYIDQNLKFYFTPFKGNNQSTNVSFTFAAQGTQQTPGNIVDYNIPRLGQRMVNSMYGIATDINGSVLNYSQSDQPSVSTYGILQGVAAYTDVKDQATLNARLQAELPLISTPDSAAITITQSEKGYPLGTYDVGDIVAIKVKNKAINFSDNRRIVGITVLVKNTGREMISVQTNKVLPFQYALAGGQNSTSTG